ncbi:TIGR03067 domain-containing protein [Gemmata sp. JC717]|uniref:TIGR03067 domain-containing protein n=1 Tax=Gemmata algarum TaxID=2975278 RepID=UPI0021BAE3F4|nr:TIGR03067 domain-containing protein [Gemmata algarum]MDY3555738.1 TIGR03067 domain-containing protein [Gemmata algarum]
MHRTAAPLLLILATGALAAEPEGDLKALQGVWVIEDAKLGGRDHKDDFAGMKLTVTGEKYVIDFAENSDKGAVTLGETQKPKQIDLTTRKDGPFKGRTLPGVYELKGDTVMLCLNSEKPDRPTKFEAPAKTPLMLLTFKREKK